MLPQVQGELLRLYDLGLGFGCLRQSHLAVLLYYPVRWKTRSYLEALILKLPCDNLGFLAFLGAVSPLGRPGKLKPGKPFQISHNMTQQPRRLSQQLSYNTHKPSIKIIYCPDKKSQDLTCICHFGALRLKVPTLKYSSAQHPTTNTTLLNEDLLECIGCRGCGTVSSLDV